MGSNRGSRGKETIIQPPYRKIQNEFTSVQNVGGGESFKVAQFFGHCSAVLENLVKKFR